MKIAPLAEVKANLSAFVEEAIEGQTIVITRNGKAAAVIIAPMDDDDLEQLVLYRSPKFQEMLNRSRQSIAEGKGIPHDEFWAKVEASKPVPAVAEKKGEYRARKK
ncbi:MAG: type II toxin-antitoxin system Phd/YefM family antitoxin [Chloroflexota bacterium]